MTARLEEVDIVARRPVWEALSTLFLDTDVSLDRAFRARVLAESPYSVAELETILADEVFPVCGWNLFGIAGEWAGFDPEWLEERITKRIRRGVRLRLGFGHRLIRWTPEWRATKNEILRLRDRRSV
jgi:hypothetical protein